MSEYEGDADLEGMAGRVMELEGQLQEKEAIVEALHAEIDDLRTDVSSPNSTQSQTSSVPGRELISVYHNKFQEFERAIRQRDNLIHELTASLQQALSARDALLARVNVVNSTKLPDCSKSLVDEKSLKDEHELSLKHMQHEYDEKLKDLRDENRLLEGRHAKELAVFQSQLVHYKKTVETLKQELVNCASCEESVQAELNMYKAKVDELRVQFEKERTTLKESHQQEVSTLNDLLKQFKLQLEDVTAKYVAISNVADSKESIEVSLERSLANAATLKQQNELFDRFSGTTDELLNYQFLNNSRLTNNSFLCESNQTMYETITEMGIQCQVAKQKLDEKLELERELTNKIESLEEQVQKAQMELQEADLTKRSYEKQLKDMKNMLDKLSSPTVDDKNGEEVDSNVVQLDSANKLKQVVHVNHKLEKEVHKLRQGLAMAWSQCAEFSQYLSQSLLQDSKLGESFLEDNSIKETYVTTYDEAEDAMPIEVSRLLEKQSLHGNMLKQLEEEHEIYLQQLKELEKKNEAMMKENRVLVKEIEKIHSKEQNLKSETEKLKELLASAREEIEGYQNIEGKLENSYAKKMQDLRVYFEQKCADMEKQYSEDVFSQHSKKMMEKGDGNSSDDTDANDSVDFNSDFSNGKMKEDLSKSDDSKVSSIISKYKNKLEKLTQELEDTKKQNSQAGINQSCQTESRVDNSILELHTESLDFMDSTDSDRLKLLEKLSGREEFEDNVEKISTENDIRDVNQYEVEILNIISAVENEHQQLESLAAIDSFKKTQLLCKTCIILNDYLEEIMHYIVTCEKEISNCLVKQQDSFKHFFKVKFNNLSLKASVEDTDDTTNYNEYQIDEFHFVPHLTEISALINDDIDSVQNCENLDKRYLDKLRSHLRNSLVKFRDEITRISTSSLKYMDNLLQNSNIKQICDNENRKDELDNVEKIIMNYEREKKELKEMLLNAEQRLFNMEKRKEVITEGYGEQDELNSFEASQELSYILEKAKSIVINEEDNESPMVQTIEELYKCIEKLMESGKRDKDDLQLQIEAADKQLRATRKFLEEQASERESERDEAAKEIKYLQEQLKEKEREKERDLRISSEEQTMGFQMRELISQLNELEDNKIKLENENKAASDKIILLKDIITEREQHILAQDERENALQHQIEQLEEIISIQTKNQEDLAQELENLKAGTENGMLTILQDELKKQQMNLEHVNGNSSALKQMKVLLQEMQDYLDKRTKELELLHVCGSNLSLSQPSEDVSIRDHVDANRCPSPDDPNVVPTLPLDQVLRLKEKLLKNGRAEEAALKRIKDLDMQVATLKNQNEELQAEHEMLQQTTSEQIFKIESMRSRFEQQKQNEPFVQKQVTSRLEFQLHESNNKLQSLERVITEKELEVIDLRARLNRANEIISEKEREMANVIKTKEEMIKKLRDGLSVIEDEKKIIQSRLDNYERVQMDLLLDKNEEIDHLKDRLAKKDKELEDYLYSIPEDEEVHQQDQPKNSARTLSDIVSINSEYEDIAEVLRAVPNSSRITNQTDNISNLIKSTKEDHKLSDKDSTYIPPLDLTSDSPRINFNGSHNESNYKANSLKQIPFLTANQSGILEDSKKEMQLINQELQEKINKLQAELDGKTQTVDNIKREIESYKENNDYLHAKLSEVNNEFHSLLGRMKKSDEILYEIKGRNKELEDENKLLNDCKEKCESYKNMADDLKKEVTGLQFKLTSYNLLVTCLGDIAKHLKLNVETEDDFVPLSDSMDKTVIPMKINEDNKQVYEALELIRSNLREFGNLMQIKKRLEKEVQVSSSLQETISNLKEKLIAEYEQKIYYKKQIEQTNEMEPQRDVTGKNEKKSLEKSENANCSIDMDYLENIIQNYNKIRSQVTQFQKVNEEMMKQKDTLEMTNDILKSQIAEYEKRILDIKSELDDKDKQILILDKEVINEKSKRRTLELKIAKNQETLSVSQQEDAELIACLRKKLATSLAIEERLQNEVLSLREKVKNLEFHLNSPFKLQNENNALRNEEILSKSVEIQNKYISLAEEHEREKRNSEKLQSSLKKLEAEKVRLKDSLGVVKEEKELLISKLTLVECKKDEIKSDFDRLKAQLKSKEEECHWLQARMKTLSNLESKMQLNVPEKANNELTCLEEKFNTNYDRVVQYFYGKAQRSESRKKALIFQKRYLVCILAGYQQSEENTLAMLARLTRSEAICLNSSYRNNKKKPRPNFKSVVLVVISVSRLKWFVSRWRLRKRIGIDMILKNTEKGVLMSKADTQRVPQIVSNVMLSDEMKLDLEPYLDRYEDVLRNLVS